MSGIAGYDVRVRVSRAGAKPGPYTTVVTGTTAGSRKVALQGGYRTCLSVRAHDRAGRVSAWTAERCYTRPPR